MCVTRGGTDLLANISSAKHSLVTIIHDHWPNVYQLQLKWKRSKDSNTHEGLELELKLCSKKMLRFYTQKIAKLYGRSFKVF